MFQRICRKKPLIHCIMQYMFRLLNKNSLYVTKTNQFLFSTLLLKAVGNHWHVCKLRSIFYMNSSLLWSCAALEPYRNGYQA